MTLKEIHSTCGDLLQAEGSYRALKNGLSDHQRCRQPSIVRLGRGLYSL